MFAVVTEVDEDTLRLWGDVSPLAFEAPSSDPLAESTLLSELDVILPNGFAEPRTEGFNLKADLDGCGGDETVTVGAGGVNKLDGDFMDALGRPAVSVG